MNTRETVFSILSRAEGEFVSGETLADMAGVSRAAVWKAVSALEEEGYKIEGVSRRGYRLVGKDVFSERSIAEYLTELPFFFFEETDSTNTRAKQLITEGVKPPFAVIAARQTGGRGRRGRGFVSSDGGIYLSLALAANGSFEVESVTTAACTGVARAVDSLGFKSEIKWVNDIYVGGRKAVGILTEGVINMEENIVSDVIIGIGLNYETKSFPEELKDIVTSLFPDCRPSMSRSEFAALEIREVMKALTDPYYLEEYREKCFILGRDINVITPKGIRPAVALSLDEKAHLVVRYEDGSTEHLSSGDVSIRTR